jgi:hypothetical protein
MTFPKPWLLPLLASLAWLPVAAGAQTCAEATQAYNLVNQAPVRDKDDMARTYRDVTRACGGPPGQPSLAAVPDRALRTPPGRFVRCDRNGCWGSANNVHYSYAANGDMRGADGSYCTRGAGKSFSCN